MTTDETSQPARSSRTLRARAAQVVRSSSPPTVPLGQAAADDRDLTQRHARAVIDLALRVGEAMLSTGASAADSTATVLRLMRAYGVTSAHVDITYTSITVSIHRGLHEDPLSVIRVIASRSPDYTRLEAVQRHMDEILAGADGGPTMDVDAARERLAMLLSAPHPYRRWVVTAGFALMSVGVVMLFGASPAMWVLAALSAALVDRIQRALWNAGVAAFFTQAVSAAVPATIALLLYWGQSMGVNVFGVQRPSLVVIAGIVVLLAGLGVLGAAQDALDGYYVTAGARGLEVLMMTLGIAVGVAVVLGVSTRIGIPMEAAPFVSLGGTPVVSTFGAMIIAAGFCLATYSTRRATVTSMLISALSWLVFELGLLVGLEQAAAVTVPAGLVGALAYASYRRLRIPEAAVATASIVALLPGLAVYRALYLIMENSAVLVNMAVLNLVGALATGLGLAGGISIGGFLARRRFGLDWAAQRARRRSRGRYVAG